MIRKAKAEDMPAITLVRTSVSENHLSIEQMAERGITPAGIIAAVTAGDLGAWVAEEKSEIVAFAMADRRNASIFALFTKPGHEGRGFGTALLAEAEAWLAAEGHNEFWLSTAPGSKAEKFYARKGWIAANEAAAETGDTVFRKRLPNG